MGRPVERAAVTAQIALAQIIDDDEDDVGPFGGRDGTTETQKAQSGQDEHHRTPGREERTKDRIEGEEKESKSCFAEQIASFIKHVSRDVTGAMQDPEHINAVSGGAKEDHVLPHDNAAYTDSKIVPRSAHPRVKAASLQTAAM
jgi:hypothetical protein